MRVFRLIAHGQQYMEKYVLRSVMSAFRYLMGLFFLCTLAFQSIGQTPHLIGTLNHGSSADINESGTGIFRIDINGEYQVLFTDNQSEQNYGQPEWGLIKVNDRLWGISNTGGSEDRGVIFSVALDGTGFTKIVDLTAEFGSPAGGLTFYRGKLWGISQNPDIIFNLDLDGSAPQVAYQFSPVTGTSPNAMAVINDELWGHCGTGGIYEKGTIFKYDQTTGNASAVHSFSDEASPYATLTYAYGVVWGTRSGAGDVENPENTRLFQGSVFKLEEDGSEFQRIHSFRQVRSNTSNFTSGRFPRGGLTPHNGQLWGTTERGGFNEKGIIFNIDIATEGFTKVRDLSEEDGSLIRSTFTHFDDKLWATAPYGGANGLGTLFYFDPVNLEFTKIHDFELTSGGRPGSLKLLNVTDSPPQIANPIPDIVIDEDSEEIQLSLADHFSDLETGGPNLSYSILKVSDERIYPTLPISINGILELNPYLNRNGSTEIVIGATDAAGQTVVDTFLVSVLPLPDAPAVTPASTTYGSPTSSGLVVSRNVSDDESVTHFQVDEILNGTLFLNDGVSPINNEDFISFEEGRKGLVFLPAQSTDGSFVIQASIGNSLAGLGGDKVYVPISVGKAPLRIIADDKRIELGEAIPELTLSYRGFVNGESESDLGGISVTTTASAGSEPGTYSISAQMVINPNYEISLVSGFLTITDPAAEPVSETITKLVGTGSSTGGGTGASVFALEPGGDTETWLRAANQSENIGTIDRAMTRAGLRIWGVTSSGGAADLGIVFNMKEDGTDFIRIHDFTETTGQPSSALLEVDGYLWGSTEAGFGRNTGTLYRFKPDGTDFEIMHEFNSENGWNPGGLIQVDDKLYGMTSLGGTDGVGVIFHIGIDGTDFEKIFDFPEGKGKPAGELLYTEGRLWGTTLSSKAEDPVNSVSDDNFGTIFSVLPDGTDYQLIHEFSKVNTLHPELYDGRHPTGDLVAYEGAIWGMTPYGGRNNAGASQGIIFRVDPTTFLFNKVHSFEFSEGVTPRGDLLGYDGKLWGMTSAGGANNLGTVFTFAPEQQVLEKVLDLSGSTGGNPVYDALIPIDVLNPFVANIPDLEMQEGSGEQVLVLSDYFSPYLNRVIGETEYNIEHNSNQTMFSEISLLDGELRFTPLENANGEAEITVKISGEQGVVSRGSFRILINPVIDGIEVAETLEVVYGSFYVNKIFVNRHQSDGAEVSHFRVSNIANGWLYYSNGFTPVQNGDFIPFEEGMAGLLFKANAAGNAQPVFQASLNNDVTGLGAEEKALDVEIVKAPLVVEATDLYTGYGAGIPTLKMTFSGFKNGDDQTQITPPSISTSAQTGNRAGAYPISLSGGEAQNYELILSNGTLTINKRVLNVAIKDKYVAVNTVLPNLEIVYSGFAFGENASVLSRPRIVLGNLSTTREGTYNVTTEGGHSDNYLFNHVGGRVQVGPAVAEKGSLGDPEERRGGYRLVGTTNDDDGTIFSIDKNRRVARWNKFDEFLEGRDPFSGVIEASGRVWGVTSSGGDAGAGVIYSVDTDYRNYTKVFDFSQNNGTQPVGKLVEASERLWGMTSLGGEFNQGVIYSITREGADFRKEHDFGGVDGAFPSNGLIAVEDKLWGMTSYGGDNQRGVIFNMDQTGANFQVVHHFQENKGVPFGDLLFSQGKLWGMTRESLGPQEFFVTSDLGDNGAIFSINLDGTDYTEVHDFLKEDGQDLGIREGRHPFGSLIEYNGSLWGLTTYGGEADFGNYGTLFELDISGTDPVFNKWYDFEEDSTGKYPKGSLTVFNDELWGLTSEGGENGQGTIFSFNPESELISSVVALDDFSGANPLNTTLEPVFVDIVPLLTKRIETQRLTEGNTSLWMDLGEYFTDLDTNRVDLNYSITYLSNSSLIRSGSIRGNQLSLSIDENATGSCDVYIKASSGAGYNAYSNFKVFVSGIPDRPAVTHATTEYGSFNKAGLEILRSSEDGPEVSYFQIRRINGGRLFHHDGVREIFNNDFITIEEGAAGLKFLPLVVGTGFFDVYGALFKREEGVRGHPSTARINVSAAPLMVRAENKEMRYGQQVPEFTLSYQGFKLNDDVNDISPPTASSIATSASDTHTFLISLSGGHAENYELEYVDGLLTINPALLEVRATDKRISYGSQIPELTLDYSGFVNGDEAKDLIEPVISTTATAQSKVGSYPITLSGGKADNYQLSLTDGTLQIDKAPLLVTADDKQIVYGEARPELTLSYSGFVNGEGEETIVVPALSTAAADFPDAGEYPIQVLGGSADNYEIVPIQGSIMVDKAILTAKPDDQSLVYGSGLGSITISYSGFVNGDGVESITEPTASTEAGSTTDAGEYTVSLEGGEADNYSFDYQQGVITIVKTILTITADDQEIGYGNQLPVLTLDYSGFVNDDDESVVNGLVSQTSAMSGADAGTYPINLSGGNASNYDLELIGGVLTINKAPLTIAADNLHMTYGDNVPQLTATFTGFLNDDDKANIELPILATTASMQSGIGQYPIIISGGAATNYNFNFVSGTVSIQKAPLTVIADDKQLIFGQSLPELTRSYIGFVNGDGPADILPPDITTDENAITGFGSYPITLTGGSADNYSLTLVEGILEVGKAVLTVTADNKEMLYGQAVPELTLVYEGFVDGEGIEDIVEPFAQTPATSNTPAGEYPIKLAGGVSNNYLFVFNEGVLTVGKAPLLVTGDDQQLVYGKEFPDFTVSYSGFVNGENASEVSGLSVSTTATSSFEAGTYDIIPSSGQAANYELQYRNGTLTINKVLLRVIAEDKEMTYGGDLPSLNFSYSGFINGDDESDIAPPTISTLATAASNAGNYEITLSGGSSNKYALEYEHGTLLIQKADLSVIINDNSMIYGQEPPEFSARYEGFVSAEDANTISQSILLSSGATNTSNAGQYDIEVAGAEPQNYQLIVQKGLLTVNKADLLIRADDQEVSYGDNTPNWTSTYTGFVNGDWINNITIPQVSVNVDSSTPTGTYQISLVGGAANNYNISLVNGTCVVNPALLRVSAIDKEMTYGGTTPSLSYTYSGFVNDDDEQVLDSKPLISSQVTGTSEVGVYPIELSGGEARNYKLNLINGELEVKPASLTVLAGNQQMIYGQPVPTLNLQYIGFVNGEGPAVLTQPVSANTLADSGSSVGTYPITLTGGSASNYIIDLVNATLTIGQAPLFAFANDHSMEYGDEVPVLTIRYEGFKNNDGPADITEPVINTSASSESNIGTYVISLSGGSAINYELILQGASLTVVKARQLIAFELDTAIAIPGREIELNGQSDSGLPLIYTSSDENLLKIEGNVATTLNAGTVTITASQEGDDNRQAADPVTRLLTINSILDLGFAEELNIAYPNPATEFFQLREPVEMIELYDNQGNLVKRFKGSFDKYDVSDLKRGLYVAFYHKNGKVGMSRMLIWR